MAAQVVRTDDAVTKVPFIVKVFLPSSYVPVEAEIVDELESIQYITYCFWLSS